MAFLAVLSIPSSCVDIPVVGRRRLGACSPAQELSGVGWDGASQSFWALEKVSDWPAASLAPGPLAGCVPVPWTCFLPALISTDRICGPASSREGLVPRAAGVRTEQGAGVPCCAAAAPQFFRRFTEVRLVYKKVWKRWHGTPRAFFF